MKLYVGNLPFSVDEEKFKDLFKEYETQEVTLIVDKFSKRSKGFGFVTIEDEEAAKKALKEMNGKDIEGRELKVSEAKPQEERPQRSNFSNNRGPRRDSGFGGSNRGRSNSGGRRY
jgi:RNA recognition motif-containing protein